MTDRNPIKRRIYQNDYKTEFIDLRYCCYLEEVIVDNLPNLKYIIINESNNIHITISNCEKLKKIKCFSNYRDDGRYFSSENDSYCYLGENLNSLEKISLNFFKSVRIVDETLYNLKSLKIYVVEDFKCNYKNFPKLNKLFLDSVKTSNIIVNSTNDMKYVKISKCKTDIMEIIGEGYIKDFEFNDNDYEVFNVDKPFKVSTLDIYNKMDDNINKIISYMPLVIENKDSDTEEFEIKFNLDNVYDSQYKDFIKDNLAKIKLIDRNYENYDFHGYYDYSDDEDEARITLYDLKFNIISSYNTEETLVYQDNNKIEHLKKDLSSTDYKEVIIKNLPNLRKIDIIMDEYIHINISDCENLTKIKLRNGDYVYIGENLNSLESIDVEDINNLEISNEIYENLTSLSVECVKKLMCNFNSFSNLNTLSLSGVKVPNDIFIDSNITKYINIIDCKTDIIEILGGGHINKINLCDNDYRILKVLKPITFSKLYLHNIRKKEDQYMPYIPLAINSDDSVYTEVYSSDSGDEGDFYAEVDTTEILIKFDTNIKYDYRYKKFIEENKSKIYLSDANCIPYNKFGNFDRSVCRITVDDLKFTIPPTKKSARK